MITQVRKWGNSMAVRLPRLLTEAAQLRPGSQVDLQTKDGRIVLTPVRIKKYRVEDLVKGMTRRNRPPLLLEDRPRGREIW